jgi:hypothetical protein
VPHLRDGFIVAKVGHRAKRDPLPYLKPRAGVVHIAFSHEEGLISLF